MKAFRYYAVDNNGNLLSPIASSNMLNRQGKYGNIPVVNAKDMSLYVNNAAHNGTSILMPSNSKYSVFDAKRLINTALDAYIRDRKDIFDYYNKLSGNLLDKMGYSWDSLEGLIKSYWWEKGKPDKVPGALLDDIDDHLNKNVSSVKTDDADANYNKDFEKGKHLDLADRIAAVNTEDTGLKDYNGLFTALSSMYDTFKNHPATKNKDIGLYQVEYDKDDLFSFRLHLASIFRNRQHLPLSLELLYIPVFLLSMHFLHQLDELAFDLQKEEESQSSPCLS